VRLCGIEVLFVLIEAPPTMHQCDGEQLVPGLWGDAKALCSCMGISFVRQWCVCVCVCVCVSSCSSLHFFFLVKSVKSVSC